MTSQLSLSSLQRAALAPWTLEAFLLRYRSEHTKRAYRCDWKRFCLECHEQFGRAPADDSPDSLQAWTEDIVLAWLRWHERADSILDARTRSGRAASRRRIMASLAAYARYLERRKILLPNPMADLPPPRPGLAGHERSSALTEDEMQRLLRHVAEAPVPDDARARASRDLAEVVIWSLLTVGMRVSELTQLKKSHLVTSAEGDRLMLNLKGGQAHDPLIHPLTAEKIRNYIATYRNGAPLGAPLFVRAQRQRSGERPLTQFGVYRIVEKSLNSANIDRKVSPHGLRATLATTLVRQHIPLSQIRDLLGHQSIQTTSIYVKRATALEDAATLKMDTDKLFGYGS